MSTARSIDNEINQYLPRLSDRQKQTILTVVKTFAEEANKATYDSAFIAEMDRRFAEMESSKTATFTLDEVEAEARQLYKSRKKKK